MANQSNVAEGVTQENVTNHQFGFRSAQHSSSLPDAVSGYLNKVYERFLNDQKLDADGLKVQNHAEIIRVYNEYH